MASSFRIDGYHAAHGVVQLLIDAGSKADAISQAEAKGYRVLEIHAGRSRLNWRRSRTVSLVLFSQELRLLLEAGLMLVDAVTTLSRKERGAEAKSVYASLVRLLQEGQPLSRALEQHPDVFPALYIATVRASEKTSDLPEALRRYLAYEAQIDVVRRKVVGASVYPAILLAIGALVIAFLMAYVVPRFSLVYQDLGESLPWMSRLLMKWGRVMGDHGVAVAIGAVMSIALVAFVGSRASVRSWVMQRMWSAPAVGERMRLYTLARFYRTLGMLLRGGIPLVASLDMAADLLSKAGLAENLRLARQEVSEGRRISDALTRHGLTTEVADRMLNVGEQSGNLGEMMDRIAEFYDEEMARWVDWFVRLFEPILMIVIGCMIGMIVVLMYMPIFELAGSLQ